MQLSIDNTELHTWFERDRQHVELRNKFTDAPIFELWDGDVTEAVEDGFLNGAHLHDSMYSYAEHLGLIPGQERLARGYRS